MLSPQITALLASLGAGMPEGMPPPPQPMTPPPSQGRSPLDFIAPFMAIGTALSGNTQAATGAFEGLAQNELRRQEQEQVASLTEARNRQFGLQAQAQQITQQRMQQEDQQRQQAEAARKQRDIMAAAEKVRGETFKSQEDYDAYVGFVESSLGVRPNTIRAIAPYRAPSAKDAAHAAIKSLVSTHGIDVLTSGGKVMIDLNDDGVPDSVDIAEAARLGNYPVLTDPTTGKPMTPPKGVTAANVQEFDTVYKGLVAEFGAGKGRLPNGEPDVSDSEKGRLALKAIEQIDKARTKPPAVGVGEKPLSRFQRATMERQLRAEVNKHLTPVRELNRQVSVMRAGIDEAKRTGSLNAATQAVINSFNRIMEPGSVTREAEYLRSSQGQPLLDAFRGRFDAISKGGPGVTLANLEEIVSLAERIASEAAGFSASSLDMIRGQAEEYGLPPDRVVPPDASYRLTPRGGTAPSGGPAVGSIVTLKDGRRMRVTGIAPDGSIQGTVVR